MGAGILHEERKTVGRYTREINLPPTRRNGVEGGVINLTRRRPSVELCVEDLTDAAGTSSTQTRDVSFSWFTTVCFLLVRSNHHIRKHKNLQVLFKISEAPIIKSYYQNLLKGILFKLYSMTSEQFHFI